MLLPAFVYGTYPEVRPAVRRFLTTVLSQGQSAELEMVDTAQRSGLLVYDWTAANERRERHFQLYAPFHLASEPVPVDREKLLRLYDVLLGAPWGPLALMDQSVGHLKVDDIRRAALIRAMLAHWMEFSEVGARYVPGLLRPCSLWEAAVFLRYNLRLRGIPDHELRAPLAGNDLRGLLERHRDRFSDVLSGDDA